MTREQMAAFMHRLADNQVVDAASVQGLGPDDLTGQQGPQGIQGPPGPAPILEYAEGPGTLANPWDDTAFESKTELLTVTVDAPSDGQVFVIGYGQILRSHVQGVFADNVVVDVTDDFVAWDPVGEGVPLSRIPIDWPDGGPITTITPQRVFDVTAGTHTFTLAAAKPDSANLEASVTKVRLSAIFFPNP